MVRFKMPLGQPTVKGLGRAWNAWRLGHALLKDITTTHIYENYPNSC